MRELGCLPHDPEAISRAPQLGLAMASRPAPPRLDRSGVEFVPHLDRNDTIGCCTAVAVANCARAAAAMRGFGIAISTTDVLGFYSQSTGWDGTPATDHGGVIAKVLLNQAQHGFKTAAGQTDLVAAWGTWDPEDLNLMRVAMAEGGAVDLGVALSVSDQITGIWDTNTPSSAGDPHPGSWGLHSLMGFDYTGTADTDLVRLGTWGMWQWATWRWVRQRTREAHLLAWRQLGAPSTIDYERLVADAALFSGWSATA